MSRERWVSEEPERRRRGGSAEIPAGEVRVGAAEVKGRRTDLRLPSSVLSPGGPDVDVRVVRVGRRRTEVGGRSSDLRPPTSTNEVAYKLPI